jgi:hypothetical protein
MTLSTEVQARLGTDLLVQLTNPDDPAATSINTTILTAACDDTEGEFLSAGIALDITDKRHLSVAVDGVRWKLYDYKAPFTEAAKSFEVRFRESLDRLKLVTSRDRITPTTDSELTPSSDKPEGYTGEVRPSFDRELLTGFNLRQPRGRDPSYPVRRGDW